MFVLSFYSAMPFKTKVLQNVSSYFPEMTPKAAFTPVYWCKHGCTHVAGYKLYPLVAVDMYLVSATKLSPVCRLSVAGYTEIQVDRDINE